MKAIETNRQISRLLLNYLIREAAIMVMLLNSSGQIMEANAHTEQVLGGKVAERPFSDIVIDFRETFDFATCLAAKVKPVLLNIKTPGGLPQTYYFHFHQLDGEILVIGQQDQKEAENMRNTLLSLNNDLSNLTRQLQKNTIALEQADRLKNQFFGMAAHDIRQPLSIIKMFSDFLVTETAGQLSDLHSEFLGYIKTSILQIDNIINDFLDFSVFEAGRLTLTPHTVDITAWLTETLAKTRMFAVQKKVEIELLPISDKPVVHMDPSKMAQVLDNLLSNALKYSKPGDRITVRLFTSATEILLSIQDQGPGISKENQTRLFNPYMKLETAPQQKEKSSGLGLAIVLKIVEAHKGRVWVASEHGQGATFTVALPLQPALSTP